LRAELCAAGLAAVPAVPGVKRRAPVSLDLIMQHVKNHHLLKARSASVPGFGYFAQQSVYVKWDANACQSKLQDLLPLRQPILR
jgi:hypothetical protein